MMSKGKRCALASQCNMRAPHTAKFGHDVTCAADRSIAYRSTHAHVCVRAQVLLLRRDIFVARFVATVHSCQEGWPNMGDKVKGLAGDPGGGVGPSLVPRPYFSRPPEK